jgi:hypothetical protein
VSDPGPDSGHPASVDDGNMSVSEGPTISDDQKKNQAARGRLAADSTDDNAVEDKPAVTINTDTGKIDELSSELPVESGVPDPGPDSDHPASVPSEKYASCNTAQDVAKIIQAEIKSVVDQISQLTAKQAGQPAGEACAGSTDPLLKNSDEVPESDDEGDAPIEQKVAAIINELVPAGKKAQMDAVLAGHLHEYVADGVRRGENFAQFAKLAEMDPAAAAMLMQGDPAAAGMPPDAGGGMPPDMGGGGGMPPDAGGGMPPEAGGGAPSLTGDPELDSAIMEVSQQMGIPPDQLLQMLTEEASQGGGDAGGGMPPDMGGGGGMPPEAGGGGPPAPPEAEDAEPESDEGGSGDAEAAEEAKEASLRKQAAFEKKQAEKAQSAKAIRKIAEALLKETGKTPQELASGGVKF